MQLVRSSTRRWLPSSDYGAVSMLLLLMTLVVTGGRRIRHVGYLESDPVVKRLCGLERVPRVHTVRRWLNAFDAQGVEALLGLNASLTGRVMRERGLSAADAGYRWDGGVDRTSGARGATRFQSASAQGAELLPNQCL